MKNFLTILSPILFISSIASSSPDDIFWDVTNEKVPYLISNEPAALTGFLGLGLGFADSSGSDNDNAEGAPSSLKVLGSYKLLNGYAVLDAGFGIHNHNFVHDAAIEKSISTSALELAARYQLNESWELGVVYNQVFNVGSNFYANQADVELLGAQILREIKIGQNATTRLGGRIMNGINVNNEALNLVMIDVQIGLQVF